MKMAALLLCLVTCSMSAQNGSCDYSYTWGEVAGLYFVYPYDENKLQFSDFVSSFVPLYGVNFTTGVRILHLYEGVESILWMSEADPDGVILIDPIVELRSRLNTSGGSLDQAEFRNDIRVLGTEGVSWHSGCAPRKNVDGRVFASVVAFTNGKRTGLIIFEERRLSSLNEWTGFEKAMSMIQVTANETYRFF